MKYTLSGADGDHSGNRRGAGLACQRLAFGAGGVKAAPWTDTRDLHRTSAGWYTLEVWGQCMPEDLGKGS